MSPLLEQVSMATDSGQPSMGRNDDMLAHPAARKRKRNSYFGMVVAVGAMAFAFMNPSQAVPMFIVALVGAYVVDPSVVAQLLKDVLKRG